MADERQEPDASKPPQKPNTTKVRFKRSNSGRNRRPPLNPPKST